MSKRPPSKPPQIPGFNAIRHLGSGGFADVFLYEDQLLGRQVAVKVLLGGDLAAGALTDFTNEANLMAQLSNHPSIVSVYQARVSDDGRPFIVMEYCSRPNLQMRYRASRFSEAETLKIGIQIAGAVETAHRAGILHRDIKPANILVTDYGRPALTDFGIAAATGSDAKGGLSVPWAPPESFATGAKGDARSDVYSLGATLYTVLAGRTPFELPGGSNTSVDVMGRIQTGALPPVGRSDVSAALEKVLATSMAKNPADRYQSAMELARALQRVQIDLGIQPTTVDVVDDSHDDHAEEEEDGLTRIRGVVTIEAQTPTAAPSSTPFPGTMPGAVPRETAQSFRAPEFTIAPAAPSLADTMVRIPESAVVPTEQVVETPMVEAQAPAVAGSSGIGRKIAIGVIAVLATIALVATLVLVFGNQRPAPAPAEPSQTVQPVDPVNQADPVPAVTKVVGSIKNGQAVFTWENPEPKDGDSYLWRLVEPGVQHTYAMVEQPTVSVKALSEGATCIEVLLRRFNGQAAPQPTVGCAK